MFHPSVYTPRLSICRQRLRRGARPKLRSLDPSESSTLVAGVQGLEPSPASTWAVLELEAGVGELSWDANSATLRQDTEVPNGDLKPQDQTPAPIPQLLLLSLTLMMVQFLPWETGLPMDKTLCLARAT